MDKLIVKQHRPLQLLLVVIFFSIVISIAIWLLLDKSQWNYIRSRLSGSEHINRTWEINKQLEDENKQLRDQVLILEQTAKIDRQSNVYLRKQVIDLQDKFYKLKAEVEFYKGILSTTQDSNGLNVQGLYIEALATNHTYRYRLVLTNMAKDNREAEGTIQMVFEGDVNGQRKTLNASDLVGNVPKDWHYKLRNFERFEGDVRLPANFVAQRVTIQLSPKGTTAKRSTVQKSFDWPSSDELEEIAL